MRHGRLLITGAAGRLGTAVRKGLAAKWRHLRITDIRPIENPEPNAEVVMCDLGDADAVARVVEGVDAIAHFAGYPREASWAQILASNVTPATLLWESARAAGVARIVFASSNHAVGWNRRDDPSDPRFRSRPDSRYGVGHAFTEIMAGMYADKFGLAGFAMRVGSMCPEPTDSRMLATWLSPGDLVQLTEVGLTADYSFEIVYGISRNRLAWWGNARAYELGYAPADSADPWIDSLASKTLGHPMADSLQGGRYVLSD
jgi:uronate dehydrogenase